MGLWLLASRASKWSKVVSCNLTIYKHSSITTLSLNRFYCISTIFTCMCRLNSDTLLQETKLHNEEVSYQLSNFKHTNKTKQDKPSNNTKPPCLARGNHLTFLLLLTYVKNFKGNPNTTLYCRNIFRWPGSWPLPRGSNRQSTAAAHFQYYSKKTTIFTHT